LGKDFIVSSASSIVPENLKDLDALKRNNDSDMNEIDENVISQSNDSLSSLKNSNLNFTDRKLIPENSKVTSWVDIQLPKLNMAFYGTLTCRAVDGQGMSTRDYTIVPNGKKYNDTAD
jgi:hypothetical protein